MSTDQQSTDRQNLVLDEAGIEDPVVFEEDRAPPAASTRLTGRSSVSCSHTRGRATPCTSPRCSASYGTSHILDVLDVLHRDQAAPRIHDFVFVTDDRQLVQVAGESLVLVLGGTVVGTVE
ncbi:hypothetical protein ACIQZB_40825, partial [Streptomyces sp. NPDC097727]